MFAAKDQEVFEKACDAWARFCEEHGYLYQQPGHYSQVTQRSVHLENVRGRLARYDRRTATIHMYDN